MIHFQVKKLNHIAENPSEKIKNKEIYKFIPDDDGKKTTELYI